MLDETSKILSIVLCYNLMYNNIYKSTIAMTMLAFSLPPLKFVKPLSTLSPPEQKEYIGACERTLNKTLGELLNSDLYRLQLVYEHLEVLV